MNCPPELTELTTKAMSAAGGFLGGTSLMAYMRPSGIRDALTRIGVSTVAAFMTAPVVTEKLLGKEDNIQILAGVAFCIGFVAWNILGAVAVFFERRQGQDVVQIVKGIKETEDG